MKRILKQCTLTFKLLSLCVLLSSCMETVYKKIEQEIDLRYEKKQIRRLCSSSIIEFFQNWERGKKIYPEQVSFTSSQLDEDFSKYLNAYLDKIKKSEDDLSHFDQLTSKLRKLKPNYFHQCESMTYQECLKIPLEVRLSCQRKHVRTFYLNKLKASWIFDKLDKENKERITTELGAVTN